MTIAALLLRTPSITSALRRADRLVSEEALTLLRHVQQCEAARSRWFRVLCVAEVVDAYLAPRFVTTIAAAAALLALVGYYA